MKDKDCIDKLLLRGKEDRFSRNYFGDLMVRHFTYFAILSLFVVNSVNAIAGGAGLEFEELIPRDDYDPSTVVSLKGRVQEVITMPKMTGMGNTTIVRFGSESDPTYIILAPDWYLKNQQIQINENDLLTVKGSKVSYKDKIVFIAAEVKFDGKTVYLRNEKTGNPEWSEWRKGEEIFYKNYKW